MLSPVISYLLTMDRKQWAAFRERLAEDGLKVGDTLRALIVEYTKHGLPKRKDK